MAENAILFSIFLIFSGAAVIATAALYARQALLVAYIAIGVLLGPWGAGLITDASLIADIANVGIIFLLFLLGLNLEPRDLTRLFREATVVTAVSSVAFATIGFSVELAFGFPLSDSLVIGAAMMFSSTIIGLKLLPTSALHHQHMGEIIVSILLLQDIIAVSILLVLQGLGQGNDSSTGSIALLFIAGVSLATNPISRYIAESLKPLRDFFLIMFFFALGAGFDIGGLGNVLLPALLLAGGAAILFKPVAFKLLLKREREKERLAGEIGVRLGQISEFSLLIAVVAVESAVISVRASSLIQTAAILSFIASSYWIVMRYPTPIAVDEKLRRD